MRRLPIALLLVPLLAADLAGRRAAAEVQQRCDGALLSARGSAELERPIRQLAFSLNLGAEAPSADTALRELQRRLAAVRTALQRLAVEELRVTSPGTWEQAAEGRRPAQVNASLQVSGSLAPEHLQALVRGVGSLPGVRLSPVTARPDPAQDGAVRARLLRMAYGDAVAQAGEVGAAIGRPRLSPLEVQLGGEQAVPLAAPMAVRGLGDEEPPPFVASDLPVPRASLTMVVRFCAR